jgi:hypothetical protein
MRGIKIATPVLVLCIFSLFAGAFAVRDTAQVHAQSDGLLWRVRTATPTRTRTPSPTPTASATTTPANSPTASPTNTPTNSPTVTPTNSPTASPTNSPTNLPTASPTNTPTNSPTNTPSAAPSPPPTSTATFTVTASPTPAGRLYGLAGQGGLGTGIQPVLLAQEYNAGVRSRLLEIGWDVLQPTGPDDWNTGAVSEFQARIDAFTATGPDSVLILDLGLQYPPAWVAGMDPLVDQFGDVWQARGNGGGVNVYWSAAVRTQVARYIGRVFGSLNFRGRLWAVRVGPYAAELLYPQLEQAGRNHSFWAFDATAQAQSPVPGWRPGDPSPNGEARTFYYWYVDNLVSTFTFMQQEIRQYFAGYVAPITPGQGVWDGSAEQLISHNLNDPTNMCCYGTGNYWQRIFARLPGASQGVINWCSSVGDGSGDDNSMNWWQWSSARQLAYLAHQAGRPIYGENPGRNAYDTSGGADPRTTMTWDFAAIRNYGYLGLIWVRETDLGQPGLATLTQYETLITGDR